MFPAGYFGSRYFPARYWPKAGLVVLAVLPAGVGSLGRRFACRSSSGRSSVGSLAVRYGIGTAPKRSGDGHA